MHSLKLRHELRRGAEVKNEFYHTPGTIFQTYSYVCVFTQKIVFLYDPYGHFSLRRMLGLGLVSLSLESRLSFWNIILIFLSRCDIENISYLFGEGGVGASSMWYLGL